MQNINARDVILYLSLKYKGDWNSIFTAVRTKEKFDKEHYKELVKDILKKAGVTVTTFKRVTLNQE